MVTLADATTPISDGDAYALEVPEGWRQGRGAFGGLTIAAMIRAIEQRVGDPARRIRSVTAELPAPTLAGATRIAVDVLRSGKSVTVARAAMSQSDGITAHAVAVLGAHRPGVGPLAWRELAVPEAPSWRSVEAVDMTNGPFPEFARQFEYRITEGVPIPRRDAPARTVGWVRPRDAGSARDSAYIAAMIDAWWPAILARMPMRPLGTIAFTLEIVDGVDGLDHDAPLLYRGTVPICSDGYFFETRELWGEDGRLVAINHQTFAIIA